MGWQDDAVIKPAAKGGWQSDEVVGAATAKLKGTGSDTLDTLNAAGTGGIRGLVRNFAGLPVDTVSNVIDLAKAGIGAPYIAMTGKAPPAWLEPADRRGVVGSSEYLLEQARKSKLGAALVDPVNPDYEGGYAQTLGGALTGVQNPKTTAQAVNQSVNSVAGAVAGKATYDATGSNALSIAVGMSPTAIQNSATGAAKYAVRGGEKGRREMEQRVSDLSAAGVEKPTLGLASGNSTIGGIENLLASTPGAVGVMRRSRDAAVNGLEARTLQSADGASTNRGAMESGRSIQQGAKKTFKDDTFKATQEALYNRLDQYIGKQTPVDVSNTKGALSTLNADIPGAPQLSKQFKNSRIMAIEDAINADTQGTRPGVMQTIQGGGGIMNEPVVTAQTQIPGGSSANKLPFEAVKKTRTLVGGEIADNSLLSDVPRSKWNPLYGALTEDMRSAATAAGPQAENAFNRANNYTRAGLDRLERVAPIVDRAAPEQTFTALQSTLKENLSTFQAVKKTLPEGARGDFAGTVIERLGKAKPGQQDATGEKWSPETFLTNWSNIKPAAQRELLSGIPNADQVRATIDSVAKATAMMRDNSKMWANPSGTAAAATARGVVGSIAAGGVGAVSGLLNPMIPIGAAMGVGGVNLLARGLTSKAAVEAALRKNQLSPQLISAQINALRGAGLLPENAQKE